MKLIYGIYLLRGILPLIIASLILLILKVPIVPLILLIPLLCIAMFIAYWINKFYETIVFSIEDKYAYAKFGIWRKREKRVPYHLVSEVRLRQGSLQRRLSLANVDVFTPATGVMRPELTYFQLDYETARRVYDKLRSRSGKLTEERRKAIEEEILNELKAIRKLLEKIILRSERS